MNLRRKFVVGVSVLAVGGLVLSGCAKNNDGGAKPSAAAPTVSKSATLAALVPADVRAKGVLNIGIGPNYAPNEYISGGKIVGWDVDLFNAEATLLGLKTNFVNTQFPQILAGLGTGTYDVGVSSFTDTKKREATVDFVTYFSAGVSWAAPTGKDVDPDNACGLRVAAQTNTNQLLQDLPARSAACTAAGKAAIQIQSYADQASANQAVVLGKADAVLADSPVLAYGVKQSGGKLHLVGKIYEAAPYGWAIAKGSPMAPVLEKALSTLIADGTYLKILKQWGVEGGAITDPTVNGAIS